MTVHQWINYVLQYFESNVFEHLRFMLSANSSKWSYWLIIFIGVLNMFGLGLLLLKDTSLKLRFLDVLFFWHCPLPQTLFSFHYSYDQLQRRYFVCIYFFLLYPSQKDFIGIAPSSISNFLDFLLVSITEVIFDFAGSHEQFTIGYGVWNVTLLHPAHKNFMGIIPSSIQTFSHFILVPIAEIIISFHGSHEQFHIGCCAWNVSLLHPVCKDFVGIIPSSIPTFLHLILESTAEITFHFDGSHKQFHIGYCLWNPSLLLPRTDFIGIKIYL